MLKQEVSQSLEQQINVLRKQEIIAHKLIELVLMFPVTQLHSYRL